MTSLALNASELSVVVTCCGIATCKKGVSLRLVLIAIIAVPHAFISLHWTPVLGWAQAKVAMSQDATLQLI